jgi:hypothetical protein
METIFLTLLFFWLFLNLWLFFSHQLTRNILFFWHWGLYLRLICFYRSLGFKSWLISVSFILFTNWWISFAFWWFWIFLIIFFRLLRFNILVCFSPDHVLKYAKQEPDDSKCENADSNDKGYFQHVLARYNKIYLTQIYFKIIAFVSQVNLI